MFKRLGIILMGAIILFCLTGSAVATTYTFQPKDPDLGDLDHHYYYTWRIEWAVPADEIITDASLFFNNIYNWDNDYNILYVHLLDSASDGRGYDNQNPSDAFAGQGILLHEWTLSSTVRDITYQFDFDELGTLINYTSDGNFGFGFDPDCHYYNNGITFTVETSPVPEPGTLFLISLGLIGILGCGLRKKGRG